MPGELLLEAFPLTWPDHQSRTPLDRRRAARFATPLGVARDELLNELRLLGTRHVVVSSNVPVRRDGLPYADAREPVDPGVAVYFERRRDRLPDRWSPYVIACDAYTKVRWNLRAIGLTVEALRAIHRHGATEMLEQAFTGFAALPPARPADGDAWWTVLGVAPTSGVEEIRAAFRERARQVHPDVGGSDVEMARVNRAMAEALAASGETS